jgi:hypothetical protein
MTRVFALGVALLALSSNTFAATNACRVLSHQVIAASSIGLPTKGARIRSARLVQAAHTSTGGYCKVLGEIESIDPKADPIRFEVNLPEIWNHKAVQFGGGAFDGYLHQSDGRGQTVVADRSKPTPLARGYATFGSDSGHHHRYLFLPDEFNALNARFGLNDEERRNFASEQLKKTHDVAVALMKLRYGSGPKRTYFVGGSTGGREAMIVVDRWPGDYDGVLAAYAAWNQIESDLQFIRIAQAIYKKAPDGSEGWMSRDKTRLLHDAVLNACDTQDGLKDGIVSDTSGCHFDAATLKCSDGRDHKGCLSTAQEANVSMWVKRSTSTFAVKNGMTFEPGFNMLRGASLEGTQGISRHRIFIPVLNSFCYLVGDGVLKFFLTKDEHFDTLAFDAVSGRKNDGRSWVSAIRQQSDEDDATLADLTPFASHGGKLLLVHGAADSIIPTEASVLLYHRIVEAMGQAAADKFLRLYLVPGYGHGHGIFDTGIDTVGVLDAWADGGTAPATMIAMDNNKKSPRTRPLCAYPAWPKYTGTDPNSAVSFVCVEP